MYMIQWIITRMHFMILFHVSITSGVEVRVCQKLPAYVPLQKPTKIISTTSTLHSPVYNSSNILKGCWVTYWKILCMVLFLKVSKPLYGYSQYVTVVIYVTNIGYVVSTPTYVLHHYIKCACAKLLKWEKRSFESLKYACLQIKNEIVETDNV